MADTGSIPANLEKLIASRTKFEGLPPVPEDAWVEVQFSNGKGGIFNLLQIPEKGTLGVFTEANDLEQLYYWRQGPEVQHLEPGIEYSLSVHPGDAIVWESAEGSEAAFKMAWWFK
jgi:hypothetical protein